MNFFGLLLCSIMALSVLTAPNGRQAAVPMARRSLGNELKESWMAHVSPVPRYRNNLIGGSN
jgi:hypothetical protein